MIFIIFPVFVFNDIYFVSVTLKYLKVLMKHVKLQLRSTLEMLLILTFHALFDKTRC